MAAKAVAVSDPLAGVKQAMEATAEAVSSAAQGTGRAASSAVKTTARVTSKGIYGTFYYTSFGVTFVLLTAFKVLLIGNNPIGRGIQDGAIAAGRVTSRKRSKGRK
jgi:hypothetical protein